MPDAFPFGAGVALRSDSSLLTPHDATHDDAPAAVDAQSVTNVPPALADDSDAEHGPLTESDTSDDSDTDDPEWVKLTWARAERIARISAPRRSRPVRATAVPSVTIPPGATMCAMKEFRGPAPGYVYTTRDGITGYFADRPTGKVSIQLGQLLELRPSLSDAPEAKRPAAHAYRSDGKRFRGRGRRATPGKFASDCKAISEGCTNMADDQFKECGLWAMDSLSPNAWSTAHDRLLPRIAADFVLMQEVRVHSEEAILRLKSRV